jgi:hypothetical protein
VPSPALRAHGPEAIPSCAVVDATRPLAEQQSGRFAVRNEHRLVRGRRGMVQQLTGETITVLHRTDGPLAEKVEEVEEIMYLNVR